jgi:hypothetical protein
LLAVQGLLFLGQFGGFHGPERGTGGHEPHVEITACEVGRSTGLLRNVPLAMEGHLYKGNSDLA